MKALLEENETNLVASERDLVLRNGVSFSYVTGCDFLLFRHVM